MAFPESFWQMLLGLYLLATIVQLVAWWGVFGKLGFGNNSITNLPAVALAKAGKQSPITSHQSPITSHHSPFSIIICARKEAENLRRYLPAVLAQQFEQPWELLVVDDASEDETQAVLQDFQKKNPERMRVLRIDQKFSPGKKHALAQGIAVAKHDLLLLTDADCLPASPRWLAHMAAMLTAKLETEIVLGYGPCFVGIDSGQTTLSRQTTKRASSDDSKSSDEYIQKPTYLTLWSRYETAFTAAQYFSFALSGMPYMGVGRNLAFKRQVYDRVGGFSKHAHIASGDDDLLVNAAANASNTALCLAPESFVHSQAPTNWSDWIRQKRRHLSSSPAYRWWHKMVLAMMAFSQVGHYFLFLVLMVVGFAPAMVLVLYFLRLFSMLFVFEKILRVLREPGLFWRIPLFDALMAVHLGAVVPWLLLGKKKAEWATR